MAKMICFDMDGTIADLYGVPNWLEMLRAEDPTPYWKAKPLVDMARLRSICLALIADGWEIRIISWLSKDSSELYKNEVRRAKLAWLWYHNFPFTKCHLVAYGATKADSVRKAGEGAKILVDDNAQVRHGWHLGETIDASDPDWLDKLEALTYEG